MTKEQKEYLKKELVESLRSEKEITKIIVFGSFLSSDHPQDMDVAIFQNSKEGYLELAMKYRKKTRALARKIPLDIIPLKAEVVDDPFLLEIALGELVYER